ncbi:MAG: hypothetical protein ACE5KH_03225 [Candidatus Geothermarchaeales archaeon]
MPPTADEIKEGMARLEEFHMMMHEDRVMRLRLAGFDEEQAETMSSLHAQVTQSVM